MKDEKRYRNLVYLDKFYGDDLNTYLFKLKLFIILKLIKPEKNYKILDMGCGNGICLTTLRDLGYKNLWGLDISPNLIKEVKKKGFNAVVGSADNLPFKDKFFDLIIGIDILHHTSDLNPTLKEVKRCSKKFAFLEPNFLNPIGFLHGFVNNESGRFRNFYKGFKKQNMNYKMQYFMMPPYNILKHIFKFNMTKEKIDQFIRFFERYFPKKLYPKMIFYGEC